MSLSSFSRRMSVAPLAGVERQGRGSVGGGGAEVGVSCSLSFGPSTVCGTHPFSVLRPHFHRGPSSGEGSPVSGSERSIRARSFTFSRLLQPDFCDDESLGVVETSYRFVNPQSESPQDSLQDGDPSICASDCTERRLDGLHRLEGRLLANSSTSGQPQLPQICGLESGISIQGALFRSLYSSASFHTGHGSGFGHSSSSGCPYVPIPGRLVNPGFVSLLGHPSLGHGNTPLSGVGYHHQLGEVQSPSIPESGISRGDSRLHSSPGFSLPSESREATLNRRRILVLRRAASLFLACSPRCPVLLDSSHSGRQATDAIPSAPPSPPLESRRRLGVDSLGSGLPSGSGMVASPKSSPGGHLSGPSQPSPRLLVRRLGRGVGCSSPGRNRFQPLVSEESRLPINARELLAVEYGLLRFQHLVANSTVAVFSVNSTALAYLRKQGGTQSMVLNSISQRILCWAETIDLVLAPHPGQEQCDSGLPVLPEPGPGVRMDAEVGGVSSVEQQVAGDDRPFCHLVESPLFTLFFTLPRSVIDHYKCTYSELGWVSGVCLSTLVNDTTGSEEALLIFWGPHDSHCSVLAPETVVPGPSRPDGGRSHQSAEVLRSPKPTTLSLPSSRDRQAVPSCLETIQRFARSQGFSSCVAKQLGFARRSPSRAVYQSKWLVYQSWCRGKDHSISHPTLPKIADFLLWLHRVRKLSVATIMGYRSMLSAVFRFKLSEISTSPVLQDLLRSFQVEAPSCSI